MCLRYADLERKLGEIDRARGVYQHCSQISDPRVSFSVTSIEFSAFTMRLVLTYYE